MKILRSILRIFSPIALGASILVIIPSVITNVYSKSRIYSVESAPVSPTAIVFGAGLTRDGTPTRVLRDRVETAAQLYFQGKVEKLLMSGDNQQVEYNEPGAMREYALELGVPDEDIVLDYAGRRTYDTCYRARNIFNVQSALVITQNFHLPRAIFTCNSLGIQAVGISADKNTYNRRSLQYWKLRELVATSQAFIDIYLTRPLPVLGKPEPIFTTNDQNLSMIESTNQND